MVKHVHDDDDKGNHTLKISPSEVGAYTVNLMYGKVPVPTGPYVVKVRPESEPDKVKVDIGTGNIRIGQPAVFKIDSKEAGYGDLKVRILDDQGKEMDYDYDQNDHGKISDLCFNLRLN